MDLIGTVLGFVLRPRGRMLPVGEHLATDPAYSAFGWPDKPVVFKFTTYSADDVPLGRFVAIADATTECTIGGHSAGLDEVLARIGEQYDRVRIVAREPGVLAVFDLTSHDVRIEQ